MKRLIIFLLFCVQALAMNAQINVTSAKQTGNWADHYVQNVLLGTGVVAFNATFTGCDTTAFGNQVGYDSTQIGEFVNINSVVDVPDGLFLATGSTEMLAGYNPNPSMGPGTSDGTGDPDLQAVLPSFTLHNAAVLEFDFVPQGDTIRFKYVFGSIEYPGFVCTAFNDVFGFFLSGPGITGPFTNNAVNLAVVPGTNTPVAINTINDIPGGSACSPACPCNSQYFVNNYTAPVDTNVQFGGLTVALEAVAQVICGDTYHIKMAIADAGDGALDSGVFLEGGSFTSNLIEVNIATVNGDSTINEGCGEAAILFTRGDTTDTSISYLTFSGTATNGVDFSLIPDSIVLLPGVQDTLIVITPFADGLAEGVEVFIIEALSITLCGDSFISTGSLYIYDTANLVIQGSPDTSFTCPPDSVPVFVQVIGGGPPPYSYLWPNGDTTAATSLQVSPDGGIDTFVVAVMDSCQLKTYFDTILVFKNYEDDPRPRILNDSLVNCIGDSIELVVNISEGTAPLSWIWSTGDTTQTTTVVVTGNQNVFITVTDGCGRVAIDTAILGVKEPDSVSIKFPDTLVYCQGSEITINPGFKGGVEPLSFAWEQFNPTFDEDSTITITINQDTTVYFWVQDACGFQYNTDFYIDAVIVETLVALLDSNSGRCEGDTFRLDPQVSGGLQPLTYEWSTGSEDTAITVSASVTQNVAVTVSDFCGNEAVANTLINIPELSPLELFVNGGGEVCFGDEFEFVAKISGGAGSYRFEWEAQNDPILGERFQVLDSNRYSTISRQPNIHYLTVNDFCGNTISDTLIITIDPCVFIPNVITPNGDGLNDGFYIQGITAFDDAHLFIYNRWGQKVFEAKPYKNEWVPVNLSHGTYYYILRSDFFGELRGDITVIKQD